jgi:hypothetical protein
MELVGLGKNIRSVLFALFALFGHFSGGFELVRRRRREGLHPGKLSAAPSGRIGRLKRTRHSVLGLAQSDLSTDFFS